MFPDQAGKDLMIKQGYVPSACTLPIELAGPLIWSEINHSRDPCAGCNDNRAVCHGRPREKETKETTDA